MAHNLFSKMQALREITKEAVGLELWHHGGISLWHNHGKKTDFGRLASEGQVLSELDRLLKLAAEGGIE
jgi:hypothetical protein